MRTEQNFVTRSFGLGLFRTSKTKQASVSDKVDPHPKNCSELKIGVFIDVVTREIAEPPHWDEIYEEFLKLTNNQSNNTILALLREATVLQNKSFQVSVILKSIVIGDSTIESIALNDELRNITRKRFKGKMTKEEFQVHTNVGVSFGDKAKEKRNQIEILNAKSGEEYKKKDWYKLLGVLGKYQGFRVDPDKVSVLEYAVLVNAFREDNKPTPKTIR